MFFLLTIGQKTKLNVKGVTCNDKPTENDHPTVF